MQQQNQRISRDVAVIGAGAIGGYFAGAAEMAGHRVTLCVRRPIERLEVTIAGNGRNVPARIVTDPAEVGPAAWVLLATKAQDTAQAAPWLARLCDASTVVAVLQNGIDHVERVAPLAGPARVLPTLVQVSAERVAPGRIVLHTGERLNVPDTPLGHALIELLTGSRLDMVIDRDFQRSAWLKLFGNLTANPITALTLRRIGVMAEPGIHELARGLLEEAVAVGRREGVAIGPEDIAPTLGIYASFNPNGGTSMLYDRLADRPTEHAHLSGALVRLAEKHGIAVPLNRAMLALLSAIRPGAARS